MFILNKDNKLPLKSLSDVIVLLNVTSFLFISNSTIDSTQYTFYRNIYFYKERKVGERDFSEEI